MARLIRYDCRVSLRSKYSARIASYSRRYSASLAGRCLEHPDEPDHLSGRVLRVPAVMLHAERRDHHDAAVESDVLDGGAETLADRGRLAPLNGRRHAGGSGGR